MNQVPVWVLNAARLAATQSFGPSAVIVSAQTDPEGDFLTYEFTGAAPGILGFEIDVLPDGKVEEIEQLIPASMVPTDVLARLTTYTYVDRFRYVPGIFGGTLDGTGSSAFGRLIMKGHSAAIAWNRTHGCAVVNEFRLGWGRNESRAVQGPFGHNRAQRIRLSRRTGLAGLQRRSLAL